MNKIKTIGEENLFLSGLVDDSGRVVASLKRYALNLHLGDKRHAGVGFGAIFTDPDFRGKGYAAELLETVISRYRNQGTVEWALLYSDIGTNYYGGFGFVPLAAESWSMTFSESPSNEGALTLRPATAQEIPDLHAYWQNATSKFALRMARSPQTWDFYRSLNGVDTMMVFSQNSEMVGYAALSAKEAKTSLHVDEICVQPDLEQDAWRALSTWAQDNGFQGLGGWWMPSYGVTSKRLIRTQRQEGIPMLLSLTNGSHSGTSDQQAYLSLADHF